MITNLKRALNVISTVSDFLTLLPEASLSNGLASFSEFADALDIRFEKKEGTSMFETPNLKNEVSIYLDREYFRRNGFIYEEQNMS